jgi:signal peptidase I
MTDQGEPGGFRPSGDGTPASAVPPPPGSADQSAAPPSADLPPGGVPPAGCWPAEHPHAASGWTAAESAPTQAFDAVPAQSPAAAPDPTPAAADAAPGQPPATRAPGYTGRRRASKADKAARIPGSGPKAPKTRKPRRKAPWWELPALVLLAILIAILVKTFVVQPFYIPSESMEKTLHGCQGCHGDRILVNKVIYDFRDPDPGDIVVFHAPPGWDDEATSKPPSNPIVRTIRGFGQLIGFVPPDGQVLVKRVIATGGQTVKGDSEGHVMVSTTGPNGPFRTLHEPYTYMPGPATPRGFGAVTVPKGRLWVMGDHRNDSADSRYHCGPDATDAADDNSCDPKTSTVPISDVIGKAFVIAWPPSRWRTLGTPSTFESAAMASASDVPALVSGAVVLPVLAVRRRRRGGLQFPAAPVRGAA